MELKDCLSPIDDWGRRRIGQNLALQLCGLFQWRRNLFHTIPDCNSRYGHPVSCIGIRYWIHAQGFIFQYPEGHQPKLEYVSWALILIVYFILIYYLVIVGWDLVYLGSSLNFSWGSDSALYFVKNVGGSSNLSNMANFIIPTVISMIIIWIFVWYISHKDLNE